MSGPEAPAENAEIETIIQPRVTDLGDGFQVRRALPARERRMVGPFVFFDQFGPTLLRAGTGLDVRPHPHIGLATVTYLLEGEILHRDSLGSRQLIRPGAVNWMTAGRGIVHSERTPPEARVRPVPMFGAQLWVALPKAQEEAAPAFFHHPSDALPLLESRGLGVTVIAGTFAGLRSPVEVFSPTLCADAVLAAGAVLPLPTEHPERAIHVLSGEVEIGGERHGAGQLLILRPGREVAVLAPAGARLLLLGGEAMDGPRHIWWNFLSSSKERIEQAKADWQAGRFAPVPGETEFIPLPE
jgi:redox-sensitive bicupin YhaK (pirin superfamily)